MPHYFFNVHDGATYTDETGAELADLSDPQRATLPDLLYGLDAFASHVGLTVPQVKWQIAKSGWPTFKQGAIVCARRSTLARHFADQERAAAGARDA